MTTKIKPIGNSTVSPYLMVESVEIQMEFLVKVFNATITNDTNRKDGHIQHGEVLIGDTTVMLGRAGKEWPARQSMNFIYVEDADAVYKRALSYGAAALMPPGDRPYGLRECGFADGYGNQWWVAHLLDETHETEDDLKNAELMWGKAIEENDVDEISRFMSDDWIIIGTEGGITTKKDFLNTISSGDLVHTKMDFTILEERVYQNAGVIVARGTSAGTYAGNPFSFYEWSTTVFIKKSNSWKAVLTMLTPAKN